MSLAEHYKKYDKEIWSLGFIIIMFTVGFVWGHGEGYVKGMNDVPTPEYLVQTFSIEMNYTQYNETYHILTKGDLEGNWIIDIEPREDYFMVGMSIVAQSENWTRFFLWIDASGLIPMLNVTIELVHITTYYQSGNTHEMNWYESDIGGMTCSDRADVYFLGYGDIDGLDTAISKAVRIRGLFG
jgi:hypothetical protein